jgi:hypothetical protein
MCKGDKCKKTATFNFVGLKALYCGTCKEDDMVNVRSAKCIGEGCNQIASFNFEGKKNLLYCRKCKEPNMVNVTRHRICIHEGCNIRPQYNKPGEKKGIYCSSHKLTEMIDVVNKVCIHNGCKKLPSYNKPEEKKGLYCKEHKLNEMVDVKSRRCVYNGCIRFANYNKPEEKRGIYCWTHKLNDMINVTARKCIIDGCKKRPLFTNDFETKPLYCGDHRTHEMINVVHKHCIHQKCMKIPVYNNANETKGVYCSEHKLEGMVNVIGLQCKSEWCSTRIKQKYDGYCSFCYMNLFPDKPVSRNYKTKEYSVVDFIKSKFPDFQWISDKTITGGCSRRRPDLLLDLGYQIIIIEVDENQHTDYDCSCENKRIMELSQDLGHRPIVFIRFNPDDYNKNGTNVTSCWGPDKNGICVVKKSKINEWSERLNALEEQITYWINPENETNKTIETIQLFYDE